MIVKLFGVAAGRQDVAGEYLVEFPNLLVHSATGRTRRLVPRSARPALHPPIANHYRSVQNDDCSPAVVPMERPNLVGSHSDVRNQEAPLVVGCSETPGFAPGRPAGLLRLADYSTRAILAPGFETGAGNAGSERLKGSSSKTMTMSNTPIATSYGRKVPGQRVPASGSGRN